MPSANDSSTLSTSEFSYRAVSPDDAFDVLRVYQKDYQSPMTDALFAHYATIAEEIARDGSIWFALDYAGKLEGFAWILIDRTQKLCKVNHLFVNPKLPGGRDVAVEGLLRFTLQRLAATESELEVLYTTMRPLAYQKDLIRKLGFRILGIFPNGKEVDNSVVNSLTAYFFPNVLEQKRQTNLTLHAQLRPLYEITRKECGLQTLPIAAETEQLGNDDRPFADTPSSLPSLELIVAPEFVARRFSLLQKRQFLSINFYPFHEPNALITDPDQSLEIFIKIFPERSMATLVGERIEIAVDPVRLYKKVADILKATNISYIEVINDAGDVTGTDAIIQAGYLPCAYFPALKSHGDSRRDYVVFARSFENFYYPRMQIDPIYLEYLKQFYQLEARAYHHISDE